MKDLENVINEYCGNAVYSKRIEKAIKQIFLLLNAGKIRVMQKIDDKWVVNSWVKKAILLAFKLNKTMQQDFDGYDKLSLLKYDYHNPRYRKAPGTLIRNGVYIGNDAVIMPSCINVGAYIGDKTMVDMNAVVGSCAQIGSNCHISASAVVGGVLEPATAHSVIIEDNCFIGVHSSVLEGVIVEEGAVVASGVSISASTKIIDRETGSITYGIVPAGSVVVSGSYPSKNGVNIACAVIVKKVDAKTKAKSSINELLREK